MSDFAKFVPPKELVYTLECKLAVVINTLVEFELLMELKIEQKKGTSLHTSC
jgi:hypothetical protein